MVSFENQGLLTKTKDAVWTLTPDGIFWGNNIAVDLLETAIRNE
jgi:oxygen-independent coproporphyrinogen-3 oxidase